MVLTGSEKEEIDSLKDVEWVELRVDEFLREYDESELVNWIEKVREKVKGKIIGTCRWYKEGGKNPYYIRDKKRIEIYKGIIDYVDFIDIELKSRILKEVVGIAKEKKKKVIISYHNFKKTPDEKKLKTFVRKAKREGADIVKIATLSNNEKSLFNLIKLTHLYSKKIPLVVIPMADAPFLRFVPIFFGSLFTYVSFSKKVAPGQISYFEFMNVFDKIF